MSNHQTTPYICINALSSVCELVKELVLKTLGEMRPVAMPYKPEFPTVSISRLREPEDWAVGWVDVGADVSLGKGCIG